MEKTNSDVIKESIEKFWWKIYEIKKEVKEQYEKHFWTCDLEDIDVTSDEFKEKISNYDWKILMFFEWILDDDWFFSFRDLIFSVHTLWMKVLKYSNKVNNSVLLFDNYEDAKKFIQFEVSNEDEINRIIFNEWSSVF